MMESPRKKELEQKVLIGNDEFIIEGNESFHQVTTDALRLLSEQSPRSYELVKEYLRCIKSTTGNSYVIPWEHPPTFYVDDSVAYGPRTWYASAFVHEGEHIKQYHDYIRKYPLIGPILLAIKDAFGIGLQAGELMCLGSQSVALEDMGVFSSVTYVRSLDGMHYCKGKRPHKGIDPLQAKLARMEGEKSSPSSRTRRTLLEVIKDQLYFSRRHGDVEKVPEYLPRSKRFPELYNALYAQSRIPEIAKAWGEIVCGAPTQIEKNGGGDIYPTYPLELLSLTGIEIPASQHFNGWGIFPVYGKINESEINESNLTEAVTNPTHYLSLVPTTNRRYRINFRPVSR